MLIAVMAFSQQKNHRFLSAGFANDSDFIKFYCHFREAVIKNDTNWISKIVLYPITIYDSSHEKITVKNPKGLFRVYKKVFSKSLVATIMNQKVSDFIINNYTIGTVHGEVWFTYLQQPKDKVPKVYLISINNSVIGYKPQ